MEDPSTRKAKQSKTDEASHRAVGSAFFASLQLAPSEHLDVKGKSKCPKCQRNMKYYCYSCVAKIGEEAATPVVRLPIALEIIHHPSESLSKSTAIHAVIVSPDAKIHESTDIPVYDPKDTVLLFPSSDAVDICEYKNIANVRRVVVIDSQWQKTAGIIGHKNLACLPCVVISKRSTFFWRYQPKDMGDDFLATIEAIYYFYRDYISVTKPGQPYDGSVDNLLFFYAHMYKVIQKAYKDSNKEFKKIENFLEKE